MGGGAAYVQQINKLSDKSVNVYPKWTSVAALDITIAYRPLLKKMRIGNFKRMLNFSYLLLDKKPLVTGELEWYRIKL